MAHLIDCHLAKWQRLQEINYPQVTERPACTCSVGERAAIVKCLRAEAARWPELAGAVVSAVADAIERGEHLK